MTRQIAILCSLWTTLTYADPKTLDIKEAVKPVEGTAAGKAWVPGKVRFVGDDQGWMLKIEEGQGGGGANQMWLPIGKELPAAKKTLSRADAAGICMTDGGLVQVAGSNQGTAGCTFIIEITKWPAKKPGPTGEQQLGLASGRVVAEARSVANRTKLVETVVGTFKDVPVVYYGAE